MQYTTQRRVTDYFRSKQLPLFLLFAFPVSKRGERIIGLMLIHCLRSWPNIKTSLCECLLFCWFCIPVYVTNLFVILMMLYSLDKPPLCYLFSYERMIKVAASHEDVFYSRYGCGIVYRPDSLLCAVEHRRLAKVVSIKLI